MTRAAAAATCGAAAEVPANPLAPQPEKGPNVNDETESGPIRSGFTRPSMVGPWELYRSRSLPRQHAAPTVRAEADVPGSVTLPSATWYSRSGPG